MTILKSRFVSIQMATPTTVKRVSWNAREEAAGQLSMPWAVLPDVPLPVFEGSGDASAVSSRATDEERRPDYFPPATRSVSPEVRGICSTSKRKVHWLSSVGFLGPPSSCATMVH